MSVVETIRANETAEVVIIGGGVIGLSIARALVLRGVKDVVLVERAGLGTEASYAGAGILAPQAEADCADEFFELARQSREMYRAFAAELLDETGIDVELDQTGTLYLAFSEEDQREIEKRYAWQTRAGLAVQKLDAASARLLEPAVSEAVLGALLFRQDIQVENRRLLSALIEAVEKLGVRLLPGTNAECVRLDRRRVAGVETAKGFIGARRLVVAGGAWTSLLPTTDESGNFLPRVPINPVRGQMICFNAQPQLARHVMYSARGYLVPRRDGRLLAGSTTEDAGFEKAVTADGLHSILSHALEILPAVRSLAVVDKWAGLRPCAPDHLPILGAGEVEGLFYATGHYRNGILLAPITGDLIAEAIVGNVVSPLLKLFTPNRFAPAGVV